MALTKEEKNKLISEFRQHETDTGSIEVQVAILTKDIRQLTDHCQKNPKDVGSKRGLLKMVCRRRRYLKYLRDENENRYESVLQRLGLRKA